MKTCTKCKIEKPFEEFSKRSMSKDGLKPQCKQCCKKYRLDNKKKILKLAKEYYIKKKDKIADKAKEYRLKNRDKISESKKEYYLKNKDIINQRKKELYIKNKEVIAEKRKKYRLSNKEQLSEKNKKYRLKNRDKIAEIKKEYRRRNPHIQSWRNLLYDSLKRLGKSKQSKTIDLLGYSAIDLKHHLESLFTEGMTWENRSEWHIDHIVPVSAFKKDTPPYIVNRLENLRPVWAVENLSKGGKVDKEEISEELLEYIEI